MIVVTVARAEHDQLEGPDVARGPSEVGDRYGESSSRMLICHLTIRITESTNYWFLISRAACCGLRCIRWFGFLIEVFPRNVSCCFVVVMAVHSRINASPCEYLTCIRVNNSELPVAVLLCISRRHFPHDGCQFW